MRENEASLYWPVTTYWDDELECLIEECGGDPYWKFGGQPLWNAVATVDLSFDDTITFRVSVYKVRESGKFGVFDFLERYGNRAEYGGETLLHGEFDSLEEAIAEAQVLEEAHRRHIEQADGEDAGMVAGEAVLRRQSDFEDAGSGQWIDDGWSFWDFTGTGIWSDQGSAEFEDGRYAFWSVAAYRIRGSERYGVFDHRFAYNPRQPVERMSLSADSKDGPYLFAEFDGSYEAIMAAKHLAEQHRWYLITMG